MTPKQANELAAKGTWFRIWMPYCFVKLRADRRKHVCLPLNRNYKPLGITSREWVDYEAFRHQAVTFKSDPATFTGIWSNTDAIRGDEHFWLYDDGPKSRQDYFERLEKLTGKGMKLSWTSTPTAERNS